MTNRDDFEFTEDVTEADIPAMCDMTLKGWAEDPVWQGMMRNASEKGVYDLLVSLHKSRLGKAETRYFKIVDKSTGKLVAWTGLLCPQPEELAEQTRISLSNMKKPDIPGIDDRLGTIFFEQMFGSTLRYGFDPAEHFHRRGTFVDAGYQRRGLGTWLTEHCNQIADEAGAATFVGARPSSEPLFTKCGFQVLAALPIDVKGDGTEMDAMYMMRHDPVSK